MVEARGSVLAIVRERERELGGRRKGGGGWQQQRPNSCVKISVCKNRAACRSEGRKEGKSVYMCVWMCLKIEVDRRR